MLNLKMSSSVALKNLEENIMSQLKVSREASLVGEEHAPSVKLPFVSLQKSKST